MSEELSAGQRRVLRFVEHYIDAYSWPPTRAEIARGLGFASPNAAEEHLQALAKKGAIELVRGVSRGIRLTGAYL